MKQVLSTILVFVIVLSMLPEGIITASADSGSGDVIITFNANGGTGGTSAPMAPGLALTAPTVTRTGYTFTGWAPAVPPNVPEESATYTAQWVANTYKINFIAFPGSVSPSSKTVTYNSTYGTLPTPSRTGYSFVGWYTSTANGDATNITSTTMVTITTSQTLYAKWINPLQPTQRSGDFNYVFDGGVKIVRYNGPSGGHLTIPSAIDGYTVTSIGFYNWGGYIQYVPFEYASPATLTLPSTITSIGDMAFSYTDALTAVYFMGNAPSMAENDPFSSNTKVYYLAGRTGYSTPIWKGRPCEPFEGVNITFDASGGTGGSGSTLMVPGLPLSAPIVTKTGYTFAGWSPALPPNVPAENTTYAAQWTANAFTVTFNPQNGTVSPASSTVTYNSSYGEGTGGFPTPVRLGYTFGGWYTSTGGAGTKILSTTTVVITSSQTLYAKWTANQYSITFDANGGTGGLTTSMQYGATLTAPIVTREGYTFAGWTPDVPETMPAENATYTAQWTVMHAVVQFDVSNATGFNGDIITVSVVVSESSNMAAATFELPFDPDLLEYVSAVKGAALANGLESINYDEANHKIIVTYISTEPLTAGGSILEVQFKIKAGVAHQTICTSFSVVDLTNLECDELPFSVTQGSIDIKNAMLGDVNNDGEINVVDALMTLHHVSGYRLLNDYQESAADVDKNGTINIIDALMILQYSSGQITSF